MKHIIPRHLKAHQFTYSNQMNKFYSSFFITIFYESCIVLFVGMISIDSCPGLIVSASIIPNQSTRLNFSLFALITNFLT